MGDIIKGPWAKSGEQPEKKLSGESLPETSYSHVEFLKKFVQMRAYILNLRHPDGEPIVKEENMGRREFNFPGLSPLELMELIWKSDENAWGAHPSYYIKVASDLFAKVPEIAQKIEIG